MKRLVYSLVILLAVAIGLALHLRNRQPVELDYYLGVVQAPLSWIVVFALTAGFAVGLGAALAIIVRLKHRLRVSYRRNELLTRDLARHKDASPQNDV